MSLSPINRIKKAVVIPDSFKGTLSSSAVADVMKQTIRSHFPDAEIISVPLADGGEGSVSAFLSACGGRTVNTTVTGPFFEPVPAFYGMLADGKTAVIEMAACAGLPLVGNKKDPVHTTTYGVGELMLHAVDSGAKKLILCLGGSATNDAGCGAAAAAGVRFSDRSGNAFVPVGGTLSDVASIDVSGLDQRIKEIETVAMCDVINPLSGPNGAAYIFAPQKGADEETVKILDKGLASIGQVMEQTCGISISQMPGGGAAGGMGAGAAAFFGAKLKSGIETVLDAVRFDDIVSDADVVFTGEGKIDSQSLSGKAVFGVANRAKRANVPVIAVVGGAEDLLSTFYDAGIRAVFSINRLPLPLSESTPHTRENIAFTMHNILRLP